MISSRIYLLFRSPGYGKSSVCAGISKNTFVTTLIEDLRQQVQALAHLSQPVLVSPSMSGQYSIPVLVADANKPDGTPSSLSGFVAVAPVNTNILQANFAKKVQVRQLNKVVLN